MLKKSLFALFVGASFFIGITACGGNETDAATEEVATEVEVEATHDEHEGHDHGAEVADMAYYCPMECEGEKTYAELGSCPVCGMDLVEKN